MMHEYYHNMQVGAGNTVSGGISRVFVGARHQRGHGIGKFLGGLFRHALPLLTRGAKAVGREALHAGYNVLSDVAQEIPVKQSLRKRATESAYNLRRKAEEKLDKLMEGEGYKTKHRTISNHLLNTLGTIRTLGSPIKRKKTKTKTRKVKKKKPKTSKKGKVAQKRSKKKRRTNTRVDIFT